MNYSTVLTLSKSYYQSAKIHPSHHQMHILYTIHIIYNEQTEKRKSFYT